MAQGVNETPFLAQSLSQSPVTLALSTPPPRLPKWGADLGQDHSWPIPDSAWKPGAINQGANHERGPAAAGED